ncbi:Pre-rRNA-processing protein ipi3 [Puccinia graminis f. sp. tritici]|uniref:Pre-rRNA-processing protein IPI3 n=1 Tax=Puccinia graminis f. sp. tritici TaxID=56615 RepID=A0A5B0MVS1_PUCGR|nr:Pre-rRNA-processing protein ipi3 [Puccinia graminis f. sp. tritici]
MSTSAILFSGLPNSSEGTQTITFHELSTSSQVHQLKSPANAAFGLSSTVQNAGLPPRKTLACLPSTNSLGSTVLTISGKDGRNGILLWSTLAGKPTPSHRLIPPGRVIVVALSPSGTYLASGSADGVIMLWELSTGTLLASFDGHYKSVTCLAFSDDEAALVSASEDSMCSVWSIPTLVDEAFDSNLSHTPYSIFSDHTLPISDLFISKGCFPDLRIFTASLDQTIKIWSPLYPSSPLLSTFAVPGPAHHLAVDPLERFIIVSYATMLKNESQEPQQANGTASQPQQSSTIPASTLKIIPLFSRPSHAAPQGGVSRVHGPSGLVQQTESGNEEVSYTSPRSTQITALHLPSPIVSSSVVLCGLSNGKVVHLSMPSLQPLGQTVPHPNAAGEAKDPVVYLSTFARPADLLSSSVADALSGPDHSGSSSVSPRPVGVLGRVVGKNGDPQRGSVPLQAGQPQRACRELCTMLKIEQVDEHALNQDDPFSLPSREPRPDSTSSALHSLPDHSLVHSHQPAVGDHQLKSQTDSIEKLTAETVHLKAQLKQALAFNDSLWAGIVDGTLAFKESALPPS